LSDKKKDTVAFDAFNFMHSPLILFIIMVIFSVIASSISKQFRKSNNLEKVKLLSVLGVVLFIIVFLLYVFGIDSFTIWGLIIAFFVVNIVASYGVYRKLSQVTVRHKDFLKAPPTIEEGPWHERGIANAKVGNFVEAVNCFEHALEAEPENAIIWNDLGFVLRKLGRHRHAMDAFKKALDLRPDYPTALENLNKTRAEMRSKRPRR
jgi:tetratricopeptide (TPR) repeat protein